MTSASSMHEAGYPKAGVLEQPRGIKWGEKWEAGFRMEGTHVYLWPIHVDVW